MSKHHIPWRAIFFGIPRDMDRPLPWKPMASGLITGYLLWPLLCFVLSMITVEWSITVSNLFWVMTLPGLLIWLTIPLAIVASLIAVKLGAIGLVPAVIYALLLTLLFALMFGRPGAAAIAANNTPQGMLTLFLMAAPPALIFWGLFIWRARRELFGTASQTEQMP